MGHNTLEMYLTRMEDIVINSLEEISSMNHPVEFLKEMKNISFKVIIDILIGSYNQHIITKIGNSFTEIYSALFSMPINLPGFAFHKGLLVMYSYMIFIFLYFFDNVFFFDKVIINIFVWTSTINICMHIIGTWEAVQIISTYRRRKEVDENKQ